MLKKIRALFGKGENEPLGKLSGGHENETDLGNGISMTASGDGRLAEEEDGSGTQRAVEPRRPNEKTYSIRSHEQPHPDAAFDHGHIDGIGDLEPDSFERFLKESVREERIRERIAEAEGRLLETTSKREDVRQARLVRAELVSRRDALAAVAARAEDELDDSRSAENEGPARDPKRASLGYAVMYIVVGLIFVAGDVAMSKSVVADGLKMEGWWEPWAFALGLGGLAFLLKPAYDRIVERPYWNGHRKWFYGVIGFCVVAVIATLVILGNFRVEAYDAIQAADSAGDGLGNLNVTEMLADPDPAVDDVPDAEEATTGTSWWAWLSFMSTTALFAVAGAVCLGIGFQHGRDYYWKKDLAGQSKEAEGRFADSMHTLNEVKRELAVTTQNLEDRESLSVLTEQVEGLRNQLDDLRDELRDAREGRLLQLYRNGYQLGKERMVRVKQNAPTTTWEGDGLPGSSGTGSVDTHSEREEAKNGSGSKRPFIAIRQAITKNKLGN